ncbi:MAG: aspartate/glutamate racemase family protein [Paracoccaceae bacterium]
MSGPRIALIHALEESVLPIRAAFARGWPEAQGFDLLDTSLAVDLADAGQLDAAMIARFQILAGYAATIKGKSGTAQAILFTCSAFGPAIEAVKARLPIPVMRPNEAAFDRALDLGERLALVVTFAPSLPSLSAELQAMAAARGRAVTLTPVLATGALAALKAGNGAEHDRLVAEACADIPPQDAVVLGQFSLARAAKVLRPLFDCPVLTTPDCAVEALKARLDPRSPT